MALKGNTNEEKIWNYFKNKGLSDYGIAGILGNLYAESALSPINLENIYERKLGLSDKEYTAAVDSGTYTNFIGDKAGFGIAQWTYWSRKQKLLEFVQARGESIGNLEVQLDFLYKELCQGYSSVLNELKSAKSILKASNAFLCGFERPADQSDAVKKKRAAYGQEYYDKYAKENETMAVKKRDNQPDSWAEEAVNWAVENKILFGDAEGNYKLHDSCTRQEMIIFLKRLYDLIEEGDK